MVNFRNFALKLNKAKRFIKKEKLILFQKNSTKNAYLRFSK